MRNWADSGAAAPGRPDAWRLPRAGTRLRVIAALTVGSLATLPAGPAAYADDLYNTIDGSTAVTALDNDAERMSLAAGGDPKSTSLRLQARNDDAFAGCNVSASRPVSFALRSSNPAVATVSPATVHFTACTTSSSLQEQVLTVTPVGGGDATITATVVSGPSPASFDLRTATFDVKVAPLPNTPPTVAVTGVDAPQYPKGSAPTPVCQVTDAEDGSRTFAPVIGLALDSAGNPIPLDEDGLGRRVATCSHTDSRGSRVVSTASWLVVDPDAPAVRYVLSKPRPANGWYREEVALDWAVIEPSSPRSLQKIDCDRRWVTADQPATTYTCTATSAGGTTTFTSEPIKKDGTPPTVTGRVQTPSVNVAGVTWYASAPTIEWSAEDAVSGVAAGSMRTTGPQALEGRNLSVRTVATDNAGNTGGSAVSLLNVDASAPVVEAVVTSTPAYQDGAHAWFKDSATVRVDASDPFVQPLERGSGLKVDPTGTKVVTASGDFTATATDNVGHTGTSTPIPVLVDAAAPVVSSTCPAGPVVKGSSATARWTASDGPTGSGLASAGAGDLDLDTSTVGRKTVTLPPATDNVGHTSAPVSCSYDVVYAYSGFFQPIANNGVFNEVKAGSAVPVKFSLGGEQGLGVLDGAPLVTQIVCSAGTVQQTAPVTSTPGLRYDPIADQYSYVWKTDSGYAGTCQKLTVQLTDGTSHSALFTFTK